MGIDTELYIGNRWTIEQLRDVIRKNIALDEKVNTEATHTPQYVCLTFWPKWRDDTNKTYARSMNVHMQAETPVGRMMLITLRMDDEAKRIMKVIANIFGGIYIENDCEGKAEFIDGALSHGNHLQYFLEYAVMEHGANAAEDISILRDCIKEWEKKVKTESNIRGLEK